MSYVLVQHSISFRNHLCITDELQQFCIDNRSLYGIIHLTQICRINGGVTMTDKRDKRAKEESLKEHGVLNKRSERVKDILFLEHEFFDPIDMVQVKYEMLRRVSHDGQSIRGAADSFGYSRPSFYEARSAFNEEGLPGLIAKKPGPRGAHKLKAEVMELIAKEIERDKTIRAPDLANVVRERLGIVIHSRSIERVIGRLKKKGRNG